MNNLLIHRWIVLLGLLISVTACGGVEVVEIPATGDIVAENYDLVGFNEVEIVGFFEAEVTQGEDFKVLVEAERALIPYLEIRVRGSRLFVGLKSDVQFNFEDASQRVELTLPALVFARIGNHSDLHLTSFEATEMLRLEVVDFSTLGGSVEAKKIQVEVSDHSSLTLAGSASQVMGDVSDFSSADLNRLDVAEVELEVDGKSTFKQ
ncbi:MAG: hypothetical protein GTO18_10540 [Anaerolineales bacterium]|nr:hypothetical protein [Anaerolineales bacterium]